MLEPGHVAGVTIGIEAPSTCASSPSAATACRAYRHVEVKEAITVAERARPARTPGEAFIEETDAMRRDWRQDP